MRHRKTGLFVFGLFALTGCGSSNPSPTARSSVLSTVPPITRPVGAASSVTATAHSGRLSSDPLQIAQGLRLQDWNSIAWTGTRSRPLCMMGNGLRTMLSQAAYADRAICVARALDRRDLLVTLPSGRKGYRSNRVTNQGVFDLQTSFEMEEKEGRVTRLNQSFRTSDRSGELLIAYLEYKRDGDHASFVTGSTGGSPMMGSFVQSTVVDGQLTADDSGWASKTIRHFGRFGAIFAAYNHGAELTQTREGTTFRFVTVNNPLRMAPGKASFAARLESISLIPLSQVMLGAGAVRFTLQDGMPPHQIGPRLGAWEQTGERLSAPSESIFSKAIENASLLAREDFDDLENRMPHPSDKVFVENFVPSEVPVPFDMTLSQADLQAKIADYIRSREQNEAKTRELSEALADDLRTCDALSIPGADRLADFADCDAASLEGAD